MFGPPTCRMTTLKSTRNTELDLVFSNTMKRIHVVAAIIYNSDRTAVFIARRPSDKHQGGLWEFPGGKVEAGEPTYDALKRELREEIGINVVSGSSLLEVSHDYTDKSVLLDVWTVESFTGTPSGLEGQEVAWVRLKNIREYDFPEANHTILDSICR